MSLGGTNLTSYTQYGLLYAPTASSLGQIGTGTSGQPLLSGGAGSAPSFGSLSLSGTGVTGTLGVANGGTGSNVTFTTGSVVFAGASGVYSQSPNLFWDNTNGYLGVRTNVPDATVTVVSPTQTSLPAGTLPAGTDLHVVGANAAITRITQDAFGTGNYPAYTGRASRGTAAAPTASQSGDALARFTGRGYGTSAWSSDSVGEFTIFAAENFTDRKSTRLNSSHT